MLLIGMLQLRNERGRRSNARQNMPTSSTRAPGAVEGITTSPSAARTGSDHQRHPNPTHKMSFTKKPAVAKKRRAGPESNGFGECPSETAWGKVGARARERRRGGGVRLTDEAHDDESQSRARRHLGELCTRKGERGEGSEEGRRVTLAAFGCEDRSHAAAGFCPPRPRPPSLESSRPKTGRLERRSGSRRSRAPRQRHAPGRSEGGGVVVRECAARRRLTLLVWLRASVHQSDGVLREVPHGHVHHFCHVLSIAGASEAGGKSGRRRRRQPSEKTGGRGGKRPSPTARRGPPPISGPANKPPTTEQGAGHHPPSKRPWIRAHHGGHRTADWERVICWANKTQTTQTTRNGMPVG